LADHTHAMMVKVRHIAEVGFGTAMSMDH
jgi:hypothetical protein